MANDMGAVAPAPTSAPTSAPSAPAAKPAKTSAPAAKPAGATGKPTSVSDFKNNLMRGAYDEPMDLPADEAPEEAASTNFTDADGVDDSTHSPEEYVEEPAAEEEDLSWVEPLKAFKDGIHGMSVQDLLQSIANGQLPEELFDKIKLKLKDGDLEWEDTLRGAKDSAMMRSNYTKKLQAFHQEKADFYADRDGFVDLVKSWKDGNGLLKGMRQLGLPIMEAAQLLAKELQEMDEMEAKAPGSRAIYEAKQKAELEAEMVRQELEHLRKQTTQQKETQTTEQQVTYVRSTAARLFQELGVTLDDGSWNLFQHHLRPLWMEAGQPNEQIIRMAIQATGEQVAQHLRSIGKTGQAAAPAPATSKPRVAVGRPVDGGRPVQNNNRPARTGVTPLDFKRRILNQGD